MCWQLSLRGFTAEDSHLQSSDGKCPSDFSHQAYLIDYKFKAGSAPELKPSQTKNMPLANFVSKLAVPILSLDLLMAELAACRISILFLARLGVIEVHVLHNSRINPSFFRSSIRVGEYF